MNKGLIPCRDSHGCFRVWILYLDFGQVHGYISLWMIVYLFVRGFKFHSRIFHSCVDVTIKFWPVFGTHSHWAGCHTTVKRATVYNELSSPRTHCTHTCCWAFSNRAVTTCLYLKGVIIPFITFSSTCLFSFLWNFISVLSNWRHTIVS